MNFWVWIALTFLAGVAIGASLILFGWADILRFVDRIDTEAEKELRHD